MTSISIPKEISTRSADFAGRRWLLKEVHEWATTSNDRFFVISGEPGCGKTALAAWLLGVGRKPQEAAVLTFWEEVSRLWSAAHFCVEGTGTRDPITFAESLARQLSGEPAFAEAIVNHNDPSIDLKQEVEKNWGSIVGFHIENFIVSTNPRDGYNRLVRKPLQLLNRRESKTKFFILVDALDEALTYGDPNIFTLLTESEDFPSTVRFLVTTRNVSGILDYFPADSRHDLSAPANAEKANEDVEAYIRHWQTQANTPSGGKIDLSEEMIGQVVERAEGNFLYAGFLLNEFVAQEEPLEMDRLPGGVYGLYGKYLDRIVSGPRAAEVGASWLGDYRPLLGRLSVAISAAPPALLPGWLEKDAGQVNTLLNRIKPLTEYAKTDEGGYRLYHRSMAEFLATPTLDRDANEPKLNKYYTPPTVQHEKIIAHYEDNYEPDWMVCDTYGLRHLLTHLDTRLRLETKPEERRRWARHLYERVRDDLLRQAQIEILGDPHVTLDDLRMVIATALGRGELVPALACIGTYRQTLSGQALTAGIFDAVDDGDFARAQRLATHYTAGPKGRGKWEDLLQLYLGWEAAAQGKSALVADLIEDSPALLRIRNNILGAALLAHTARLLAETAGQAKDSGQWLETVVPGLSDREREGFLKLYKAAEDQPQRSNILEGELEEMLNAVARADSSDFLSEATADMITERRQALRSLAAGFHGQQTIDRLLELMLLNAYPRYRDIGLSELGVACLAARTDWARPRLRNILRVGLNVEGVIFTFDLPAILLAEAHNPRRAAIGAFEARQELDAFLAEALSKYDKWGTAMRAQSARAAGLFWQGEKDEAFAELERASARDHGFSGYGTLALLSLANRCQEFGEPQRARQPVWGPSPHGAFVEQAANLAQQVNNPQFRRERIDLVNEYEQWWQAEVPTVRDALQVLGRMPRADYRRVYKDHVSARWIGTNHASTAEGLQELVLVALNDGTTLDALLGRLFGPHLAQLSDEEYVEALDLCARYFTVERPWEEVVYLET